LHLANGPVRQYSIANGEEEQDRYGPTLTISLKR
jgi:hypothetical protein